MKEIYSNIKSKLTILIIIDFNIYKSDLKEIVD